MFQHSSPKDIEPLIPILADKIIPCWECRALESLAVTAPALTSFRRQELPGMMRASVKKRTGRKASRRGTRNYNNSNSYRQLWEEDGQAVYNYPALIFVVEGQADFHVADYVVHCPQNHFLLFSDDVPRPKGGAPHLEGTNQRAGHCAVLWFFAPPGTNSVIAYVCHSRGNEHWSDGYRIVHQADAVHSFKLFVREIQERAADYQPVARSALQTFLHLFLRELQTGRFLGGRNTTAHAPPQSQALSPAEQAQQYVRDHLNQPLTTTGVAREVYMSRNSFLQHFKRETGQTFHDFVIGERMREAHRLLHEGHWSIAFVCRFIGLKPSQFRALFKSRFGVSPSEFRRQAQTKGQNR